MSPGSSALAGARLVLLVGAAGVVAGLIVAVDATRDQVAVASGKVAAVGESELAAPPSAAEGRGPLVLSWPPGDPLVAQPPGEIDHVYRAHGERLSMELDAAGAVRGTPVDNAYQWTDANGWNVVLISYAHEQADGTPDPLAPISLHVVLAGDDGTGLTVRSSVSHTAYGASQGDCGTSGRATVKNNALAIDDVDSDGVAEFSIGWATTCRDVREPWQVGIDVLEGGDTYTLTGDGFLSPGEAEMYRSEHPDWPGPSFVAVPGSPAWPGGSSHATMVLATEAFGGCQRGVVAPCGNADAGRP